MPNVQNRRKGNAVPNSRPKPNNRRMRNNRPSGVKGAKDRNCNNISSAKRTPDTIISALAANTSRMSMGSPYVDARLYCCVPTDTISIPDGSSGKHFPVCLYSRDRLTFSGTGPHSAVLQFNPWLPTPGFLAAGATAIINGTNFFNQRAGLGTAFQFSNVPPVHQRPGALTNTIDVYGATTCRIVAQTHSIRYTGPTQTCAGMLLSWPNSVSLNTQGTVTSTSATGTFTPTTGRSVRVLDNAGAWLQWAPVGTEILNADIGDYTSVNSPAGTVCARPEQGMTIRLSHKGSVYDQVPFRNVPAAVIPFVGSTSATNVNADHLFAASPRGGTALCAFDNSWEGQVVSIENVNSDASFMIETCLCVEFTTTASSPFYPASRKSPASMPNIISTAERTIAKQGTAIPGIPSPR